MHFVCSDGELHKKDGLTASQINGYYEAVTTTSLQVLNKSELRDLLFLLVTTYILNSKLLLFTDFHLLYNILYILLLNLLINQH